MGKLKAQLDVNKQVLYKKSNITCNTYSRTCSEASQFAKSAVKKVRKNASKSNINHQDIKIIKNDLSIETDNCVIRRYLKHKRDKLSARGGSSAKSAPSCQSDTEDDGDLFKPDKTASGDTKNNHETCNKTLGTVDITSLMLENLKSLLIDWTTKHVLVDHKTKLKLVRILNSLKHNLGNNVSSSPSSCSTYILDRNGGGFKVRNRKTATNSLISQYCKRRHTSLIVDKSSSILCRKYSHFTIPVSYKHLRIISTLSIPRNMHKNIQAKQNKFKSKNDDMKNKEKITDKFTKGSKSSTNLYIHKKSCSTYNFKTNPNYGRRKRSNRRGIIIFPDVFYDSTADSRTESENYINGEVRNIQTENINIEPNQSLLKSIYENNTANFVNCNETIVHENKNTSLKKKTVNVLHTIQNRTNDKSYESFENDASQSVEPIHRNLSKLKCTKIANKPHRTYRMERFQKYGGMRIKNKKLQFKNKRTWNSKRKQVKYDSIKCRKFNYIYRKTNRNMYYREFVDHMSNILRYFAQYKGKRNIKLEIHVDVYPSIEIEKQISNIINKSSKCIKRYVCPTNVFKTESTLQAGIVESDVNPDEATVKFTPDVIPILDGAISPTKIFKSNISTSIGESENKVSNHSNECGTVMTGLEVSKEISDLKYVIKNLSATTEKIITEHLKRKSMKNDRNLSSVATVVPVIENTGKTLKGIQLSNISPKTLLISGLKLTKEPKRVEVFTDRLKKQSSSYHVIDSESILRVTDMTSLVKSKTLMNRSCSPPKSKSLLDVTKRTKKREFQEFFYDERRKNRKNRSQRNLNIKKNLKTQPLIRKSSPNCKQRSLPRNESPNCKQRLNEKLVMPLQMEKCQSSSEREFRCNLPSYSSVCLEIDKPTITVKSKDRLTFLEGCVYCVVLWIPLIVLIYFFYDYVLKDLLNSSKDPKHPKGKFRMSPIESSNENSNNVSQFLLKLSDFGF